MPCNHMLIYKTDEKEKGTSESDTVQKISLMRLSFRHENTSDVESVYGACLRCFNLICFLTAYNYSLFHVLEIYWQYCFYNRFLKGCLHASD